MSKLKAKVDLIAINAAAEVINGNIPDVKALLPTLKVRSESFLIILLKSDIRCYT